MTDGTDDRTASYQPPAIERLGTLEELTPEDPDDGLGVPGDRMEGSV